MEPGTPNFYNTESKLKQEVLTPEFLQEQIRLPEEQWSPEFSKLIEEKTKKRNQNNKELREWLLAGRPESPPSEIGAEREDSFRDYEESIGLHEDDLRGKRILDLGCGRGGFVEYLIAKGITAEAYGIDMAPENSTEDIFKNHFFKGNIEQDLPVHNLDYIVSRYSMFHEWKGYDGSKDVMNLPLVIEKSLNSLNEDGEIRISGVFEVAQATPEEKGESKIDRKKWEELLLTTAKMYEIKYTIEPLGIEVYNNYMDDTKRCVTLNSVLIIRKK